MEGKIVIGTEIDTIMLDKQIDLLEDKLEGLVEEYEILEKTEPFEGQTKELIKLGNEISTTKNKLVVLYEKQSNISKIDLSKLSKGMSDIIGKVTKWGLALFGIRTAYSFIRSAVNEVVQQDELMKNQIEYMKYAVGTALKPVFEIILNVIYKIIAGIGSIIKLITGINIFSKATANNFKNMNTSASALRKTLAGFDEMNVINQSGGTGLLGDISSQLDDLKDLSIEVENMAKKIKRWFLGGDTLQEGLDNFIPTLKKTYEPFYRQVLKPYIIDPFVDTSKQIAKMSEPIWRPMYNSAVQLRKDIKELFAPFVNWFKENVLDAIKTKINSFKNEFLKNFAPFINKIIYWINNTFGVFGVKLDYIEIKSDETGNEIKQSIGGALDDTKNKADKLSKPEYTININSSKIKTSSSWLDNIIKSLKELTSKTWNIVTSFASGGISGGTINGWLQPLRDKLSQIGIKLPYLARGGIVNNPGNGVFMGGYVAGERGQEGVIPLTDSQQMALLGEAIGKYININATVPVYVGNRMVAREIKRINAEDDFAYNR